jgi:hypothetical protein
MAIPLKQSTAGQEIILGYFVDDADGNTEETALTINNTDIKIWKNGATSLVDKNSGGATHISNGLYYTVLDATDTNTVGPLIAFAHVTGALPVRVECCVYTANVYDSLIAGSDKLETDVTQFGGTNATASGGRPEVNTTHAAGTAWASGAIVNGAFAANALTADKVAADVSAEIADAVWDEATAGHVTAGTFGEQLKTDVDAILDDTGTAGVVIATAEEQSIADSLLDRADAIEVGLTLRQALRLIAAASAGKLSGAATTTITIRNAVADSKTRITATVDASGNRSALTTDVT